MCSKVDTSTGIASTLQPSVKALRESNEYERRYLYNGLATLIQAVCPSAGVDGLISDSDAVTYPHIRVMDSSKFMLQESM